MELLELSQIIVNFTVSLAALVIGLAVIFLAEAAHRSIKSIETFFTNVNEKSAAFYRKLNVLLAGASVMPIISKIFKKSKKVKTNSYENSN